MDKSGKFLLPSPKFLKVEKTSAPTPHFLSPQGMLLPKEKQPPPMYGPRGSTIPPKFLDRQNSPNTRNQPERTPKFYCDPCEAEFHTSTDFKVHRSEHVQCEIDNCSFRGHPSFMDTHIGLQHATGLYNQLKKLNTPEEIAAWRAERKKNYPTVAIVLQKQKAREQRMQRGEKLEAKKNRFGNREDRRPIRTEQQGEATETGVKKNSRRNNRKRNRAGRQIVQNDMKKVEAPTSESVKGEESVGPAVCGGLKMFTGTGGLAGYKKMKKVESHALTGLLGMYGSDSEEEEENVEQDKNTGTMDGLETEKSVNEVPTDNERNTANVTSAQKNLERQEAPEKPSTSVKEDVKDDKITQPETTSLPNVCNQSPPQHGEDDAPEKAPITKSSNTSNEAKPAAATEDTCDPSIPKDSDDEAPDEAPIAKTSNIPYKAKPSAATQDTCDPSAPKDIDDEAPDEAPIAKSSNIPDKLQPTVPPKKEKPPPKKKVRQYGLDYRKLRVGRQNTMLEKLLEGDIRHERNVLLQCVRFVVENNFFGIGSPPTQPQP